MIKIKNWQQFQHYNKRNPPWIKLHKTLLDNYNWHCLQDASKALAICLWLLASEESDPNSGLISADVTEIAFRARMDKAKVSHGLKDLEKQGFIENASNMLATCYQDAIVETETEERQRRDRGETEYTSIAFDEFKVFAEKHNLSVPQVLNETRKRNLRQRLKDCGGIEGWRIALEKIQESEFLLGLQTDWKADFDFILQKKIIYKANGRWI